MNSYRSNAIATRWRIDAVQQRTSNDVQRSHSSGPNFHSLETSYTADNGITRHATSRSATASDKIKLFATLCKFFSNSIAAITNTFPVAKKNGNQKVEQENLICIANFIFYRGWQNFLFLVFNL